jgi:hypothetical protein
MPLLALRPRFAPIDQSRNMRSKNANITAGTNAAICHHIGATAGRKIPTSAITVGMMTKRLSIWMLRCLQ